MLSILAMSFRDALTTLSFPAFFLVSVICGTVILLKKRRFQYLIGYYLILIGLPLLMWKIYIPLFNSLPLGISIVGTTLTLWMFCIGFFCFAIWFLIGTSMLALAFAESEEESNVVTIMLSNSDGKEESFFNKYRIRGLFCIVLHFIILLFGFYFEDQLSDGLIILFTFCNFQLIFYGSPLLFTGKSID